MVIFFICRSLHSRLFCRFRILVVIILFSWLFCWSGNCCSLLCRCFRLPGCSHQLSKSLLESFDLCFLVCRRRNCHAGVLRSILVHVSEEFVLIYRLIFIVFVFIMIIIVVVIIIIMIIIMIVVIIKIIIVVFASYRLSASLCIYIKIFVFCIAVQVSLIETFFRRSFFRFNSCKTASALDNAVKLILKACLCFVI